jgi:hypothetical protein
MQSKDTQALKQKTTIRSKSQKEQKSSKAKQLLQQPSKGKLKSISIAMTSANQKFKKRKRMLNANELCKAGQFCVELHNYYIMNWKKIDVIVVKYRQSHFLTDDSVFMSYPVFMPKLSTHRMHDPGSNVPYIRPKVLTDNQMS